MVRVIAAMTAAVLLALGIMTGGIVLIHVMLGSGQAGSSQTCQFARWENQQLWPQGGGPPLPPGC